MNITDVHAQLVAAPLPREFGGSYYSKTTRETVVVTLETSSDAVGHVYSGDFGDVGREQGLKVLEIIREDIGPELVGKELFAPERLWEEMFTGSQRYGVMSCQPEDRWLYIHAMAALDTAIWDAIGKHLDTPLYKLWGGYRESLPITVTGGYYERNKNLKSLAEEILGYKEMGFAGVKMKVGKRSVERDLERLAAVREAVGDDFIIGCDANQGWDIDTAVEFARGAREHDVRWYEEPVVWYDQYRGMREVRQRTGIRVAAGQSEMTATGCRRLIDEEAVDILNFDAHWGGGPTLWRKVANYAAQHGIKMNHHEEPHIAMHLLASVPNGLYLDSFEPEIDPVFFELVENTPEISDGTVSLPDEPGLGLHLNIGFIEEYALDV